MWGVGGWLEGLGLLVGQVWEMGDVETHRLVTSCTLQPLSLPPSPPLPPPPPPISLPPPPPSPTLRREQREQLRDRARVMEAQSAKEEQLARAVLAELAKERARDAEAGRVMVSG